MTFSVNYFDARLLTGSDADVESFDSAKRLAEEAVATGMADRAEIRDENGALLLVLPNTAIPM